MVQTAEVTDIDYTVAEMERHVARFADQKSSHQAFLDTRIPGHEREIFSIIGNGVQEDADMRPPIEPQEFHLAFIRAEPGKGAALHSHLTQEVFVPISGRWAIFWGPNGEKEVELGPCDVISVPLHIMRGFRNVGDESAVMLAVVGGKDPGRVGWPDSLKAMAKDAGLVIDDDGNLRELTAA
ncbi:MAG: cupin domain-containing protein [Gammaproteobacteria bacterium]|nr:cupin domain-containing protein [Gammaproteobacteria bacterium]MCP5198842.1 cupin domain-containing protein [Gammaproteobacteria bacterium]